MPPFSDILKGNMTINLVPDFVACNFVAVELVEHLESFL